jgi:hypothetical protein
MCNLSCARFLLLLHLSFKGLRNTSRNGIIYLIVPLLAAPNGDERRMSRDIVAVLIVSIYP